MSHDRTPKVMNSITEVTAGNELVIFFLPIPCFCPTSTLSHSNYIKPHLVILLFIRIVYLKIDMKLHNLYIVTDATWTIRVSYTKLMALSGSDPEADRRRGSWTAWKRIRGGQEWGRIESEWKTAQPVVNNCEGGQIPS